MTKDKLKKNTKKGMKYEKINNKYIINEKLVTYNYIYLPLPRAIEYEKIKLIVDAVNERVLKDIREKLMTLHAPKKTEADKDAEVLKSAQIEKLTEFLEGGELNPDSWREGRIALTPNGRLVADRIVRKILF